MNADQNHIEDNLIVRALNGEASAEDEKQLAEWIAQSKDNENHYLRLKKTFDLTAGYKREPADETMDIDVEEAWDNFVKHISQEKENKILPLRKDSRTWWRAAAALVLLVAAGAVINYFVSGSTTQFSTTDNTLSLSLSDGSKVLLNRNSELSYTSHFGSKKRTVKLKGEAFFEVAHNDAKPFIIQVNDAEVEVLGTTFDVQGYEDRPAVEVTVETGIVKLSLPNLKKEVRLHAGEKGVYTKAAGQINSLKNDDVNFLSWNTRKLVFVESDLRTVVETINKAYGSHIIIAGDIPPSCVVTVTFEKQSLEAVLNVLKTTLNLTYRTRGPQIEIDHACLP